MEDVALRQLALHLAAQLPHDREAAFATVALLAELTEGWLFPSAKPPQKAAGASSVIKLMRKRPPQLADDEAKA